MKKQNELIVIEQETAMDRFTTEKGLDPVLHGIQHIVKNFSADVNTD